MCQSISRADTNILAPLSPAAPLDRLADYEKLQSITPEPVLPLRLANPLRAPVGAWAPDRNPCSGCGPVTDTCCCFKSIVSFYETIKHNTFCHGEQPGDHYDQPGDCFAMQIWEERVRWGITATRYCCNLKSGRPSGESRHDALAATESQGSVA